MSLRNKVLDEPSLKKLKPFLKDKKIILCHGVFDLLHMGHINYFHAAKKIGDILVVSVTSDEHVNKGPGRPAFKIRDRVKFLKEINCIDFICISNAPTSEKIIKNLRPNFYCKGPDYLKFKKNKKDFNLQKELKALNSVKGKFKIVNEVSFSSSEFINQNQLQNLHPESIKFINSIKNKTDQDHILKSLNKIKNKKVLIIGETIIDNYITTEAVGKSGKEPVMVVKQKKQIKFLGGVGYIANLCSSFVKETKIISFLGEKKEEKNFIFKNLNKKIKVNFLFKKNSPTIVKTRYLDDYRKSKLLGVYDLNDNVISKQEEKKFLNILKFNLSKYDLIIVADYGHGIITKKVRNIITKNSKKLFLNTQINSFNRGFHTVYNYKKINSLIINDSELRYELKDKNSDVLNLAKNLKKKISVDNLVVTKGKWGSILINCKDWSSIHCPAFSDNNIDTVGAGDTFFALSSLSIGSKLDNRLGLLISSLAASYSTNQIGNLSIFNYKILEKQLNHILK
mgnify:CR=1 FL=1|jgi:rfaE bifunctional protein kinase chain/domain/rfaE bifunctional protein nucleotidyltransferase chain/domain